MTVRFLRAATVPALFVSLAMSVPRSVLAQSATSPYLANVPATLITSGQGEAKATPDRASVMVNVQTRGATAAAAGTDNAQRTRAVLTALEKLGLPKDQLSTEGYSVYPEMAYDRNGGSPRVAAYVVTNTVRAETRQPSQAGAMVDAALGAGANMINSLSFYASSIEEPRRLAILNAVSAARADAEAMARAAGGTIGALLELSTQGPTMPPRPMYDMAQMRRSAVGAEATPVNPGQQTVTVHISARWMFVPSR